MTVQRTKIEIIENLNGSILDIGGGGEGVIGQIYGKKVIAIDNRQEELDEAPDCCQKELMDATELLFPDESFDQVTFFYSLMYMTEEIQHRAICEAARVLKVNGSINIWDCDIHAAYPKPFVVDLDIRSGNKSIHTSYGIVKKDKQSSDSITQALKRAGLKLVFLREEDGHFHIQCAKEEVNS
ncbi:MAG: class I SAM-dependent methyltransferase [Saccharofermentanales bacterium]|jgi:ubiquinone/menaquinone biosynthesis C-methylase UbiE|nr:class I SAM-dependent methyltransferase [Clostridiales bacterium]MDY5836517.1 class I SAM-dependent methyltransferase [Eubacteriales bacterium]